RRRWIMRYHEIRGGCMKRLLPVVVTITIALLLPSNALPYTGTYTPGAGINRTVHDLATAHDGMNYTAPPSDAPLNRICISCHATHNTFRLSTATGGAGPLAPAAFDYLPLWNHNITGFDPSFTMYENGPGAPQSGSQASQAILSGMTPGSTS